jgi:CreA protein
MNILLSTTMKMVLMSASFLSLIAMSSAKAEIIGSVDTVFKILGPDHKIMIEAFDDPDIKNITCYLSHAKTGGIKGGLGLAEDTADAALACQQTGPIQLPEALKSGSKTNQVIFKKRTSLFFKKLRINRFYDSKRNTIIYLAYSDKLIDGSPKSALSAVPIKSW